MALVSGIDMVAQDELAQLLENTPTIDLWDLPEESALQTRTDRKYSLTAEQAGNVLGCVPELISVTVNGLTQSNYESVYFDTPALRSYTDAAHGRRRRFKVRTRTYVDTATSLVEIKVKSGRGETIKSRIESTAAARTELNDLEMAFVATTLEASGIHDADHIVENLTPSLATLYKRATLLAPDGSRTTVDTNLECVRGQQNVEFPALVLIETKSNGSPNPIDKALWKAGHRPQSISKFATGMALLQPDLHHNKWHRVLNSDALTPVTI